MRIVGFVLFTAGIVVVLGLVGYYGYADVGRALVAGAGGIVAVTLFHALPLVADAIAWRRLLPPAHRPRLRDLAWMRWIGESVNSLLPAGQVGGDVVRAHLAARSGVPAADAMASIIADITTSVTTLIAFGACGALLLLPEQGRMSAPLLLGLAVSALLVGTFYLLQRARLFSRLAERAAPFLVPGASPKLVGGARALDAAIAAVYARRRDVLASCAWAFGAWVAGAGEVWLALRFLGVDASVRDALILESLIQALRGAAFVVPGAVGVQEAGLVALGGALGIDGGTALALALVKRSRELLLGVPGIVAWHVTEGRRLLGGGARARSGDSRRPL